jgi:hypothetical protein
VAHASIGDAHCPAAIQDEQALSALNLPPEDMNTVLHGADEEERSRERYSLYRTPTTYASQLTAIGHRAALDDGSARRPIAHTAPEGVSAEVVERYRLGDRLTLVGEPEMQAIGEACHRVFACDDPAQSADARLARASALLQRRGAPNFAPTDLMAASDRLHGFVSSRFGDARSMREWPVHAIDGT